MLAEQNPLTSSNKTTTALFEGLFGVPMAILHFSSFQHEDEENCRLYIAYSFNNDTVLNVKYLYIIT